VAKKTQTQKPFGEETPKANIAKASSYTWKSFLLPGISLFCLLFLFFDIYSPKVTDPWYAGSTLCSKANRTEDTALRNQYLNEGGTILLEQNRIHPYHARVWFLLGYYYLLKQDYDSAVYCQKQAVERGVGGIVNEVEYQATEMLNSALGNQLNAVGFSKEPSLMLIAKATTYNFYNPVLEKYKGQVYANSGDFDLAVASLQKFLNSNPKDFTALYLLAVTYYNHGDKELAKEFAIKARKVNPNNEKLNAMILSFK
jgi:tetratricopeptide (TPR) repeat protein